MLPNDLLYYIFELIGDYDELTLLRNVNSLFKKIICKTCVTKLILTSKNKHVLYMVNSTLLVLNCEFKQLTSLPELPKNVKLYCSHNQLISLPNLPNNIELYCSNNFLTSLPKLPNNKN
jgi:hypothetical protein